MGGDLRKWGLAAAFALCVSPAVASAQDEPPPSLAQQAETALEAGDAAGARSILLGMAAAEDEYERKWKLARIGSALYSLRKDGQLRRADAFARFAYETFQQHPLRQSPLFTPIANYRAEYCAVRGDLDCLDEASAAAVDALEKLPEEKGDYEADTAIRWRAKALAALGRVEEARPFLKHNSYDSDEFTDYDVAFELDGMSTSSTVAPSIGVGLAKAALSMLDEETRADRPGFVNLIYGHLGHRLEEAGRLEEAEAAYREAYAIALAEYDPDASGTSFAAQSLARVMVAQGRWDEAMPLYERNWDVAVGLDDWSLDLDLEAGQWMLALIEAGRVDEADRLSEEVLAKASASRDTEDLTLGNYANIRGIVLLRQGRYKEAEGALRKADKLIGDATMFGGVEVKSNLAAALEARERYDDAEALRRKSYTMASQNLLWGAFNSGRVRTGLALADNLAAQGKAEEAERLYTEMIDLARELAEPSRETLGGAARRYARFLLANGRTGEAVEYTRIALDADARRLGLLGSGAGESAYLAAVANQREAALLHLNALLQSGAEGEETIAELFESAQRAGVSAAASAISIKSAQVLARKAGAGDALDRWRAAQDGVKDIDRKLAAAVSRGTMDNSERLELTRSRAEAFASLAAIEAQLEQEFPRFFDLARPVPASLEAVRAALGKEEALVVLVPGDDGASEFTAGPAVPFAGMVLVVTRDGAAAAPIAMEAGDLELLAAELHGGLAELGSGYTEHPDFDPPAVLYDRAMAHDLYGALFGDPSVAGALDGKSRWTLAPQGSLVGISYEALVTAPPPGGSGGDADPAQLRATAWLGLERALAVTPSVSAITIARGDASSRPETSEPFFGLGDPAFDGEPDPPLQLPDDLRERGAALATRAPDGSSTYYRGGVADLDALARLARLPGTASEIRSLANLLGASEEAVITQLAATEANVRAQSEQGSLARAGLVVFATHGLISGELGAGLAEPALALTPPPGVAQEELLAANDGLLTATEAAALQLAADWLILSACNTSSGAGGDAEGLSGLARGFLFAGARSLLVSHFPVSDQATPLLTIAAVEARRTRGLDAAEALLEARRAMIASTEFDGEGASLAHPKAWAALSLVTPE